MNRHYIKNCVDREFKWNGKAFVWSHPKFKFEITVTPTQTETGTPIVSVTITDQRTNTVVKDWSHDVRCGEGDWRDRLQSLVGNLLIKAQHRPFCPLCNAPMRVKSTKGGDRQFFGCSNYRGPDEGCQHTKDISKAFEPEKATSGTEGREQQAHRAGTTQATHPPPTESLSSVNAPS